MTAIEGHTLSLDIGGSGIKGMVLDATGQPLNDKIRIPTPRPATPEAVLDTIAQVAARQPAFDRVSVGFPGVVSGGIVSTGANFDGDWSHVPLARRIAELTGKPCRAANDADVQGYGVIEGKGLEMVITLGTGMGAAVFTNGHLAPNLELGHHPFADGVTYEELVGQAARDELGEAAWNEWVRRAVDTMLFIWNPRVLYLGGGNAKELTVSLPDRVQIVRNVAGILGGIRLWEDESH